jgi:hypothetical protein
MRTFLAVGADMVIWAFVLAAFLALIGRWATLRRKLRQRRESRVFAEKVEWWLATQARKDRDDR